MQATIYSSPHCGYCKQAIKYLKELGVKLKVIDITKNEKAAVELVRKTGQTGVPVIFIKGQKITGFDRNKINSILGV